MESSNGNFALVYESMLRSSIWLESKEARLVWLTLLLLKDKNGFVAGRSAAGLAHIARVELEECEEALKRFQSPDPHSSNPDNEGRRIEAVPGGWQILNHEVYRFSTAAKRLAWAEHKRAQRERLKAEREAKRAKKARDKALEQHRPLRGELQYVKAKSQEEEERILEANLPPEAAPPDFIPMPEPQNLVCGGILHAPEGVLATSKAVCGSGGSVGSP